ncbi:MAG: hypothetical protein KJ732_07270 [Candidatus Margulisbacteria bacterium]|nr:hypothetical protein [Candidatus Margulisiibacteriota bacterium]
MFELNWILLILIAVGAIILLFNIWQLIIAYRKKKTAQQDVKILDKKIDAIKDELLQEKKNIESAIHEELKKVQKKRK